MRRQSYQPIDCHHFPFPQQCVRRSFGLFCQSRSLFNTGITPAALICAANYCRTSAKKPESIDEKVNTRIDTAQACHKHSTKWSTRSVKIKNEDSASTLKFENSIKFQIFTNFLQLKLLLPELCTSLVRVLKNVAWQSSLNNYSYFYFRRCLFVCSSTKILIGWFRSLNNLKKRSWRSFTPVTDSSRSFTIVQGRGLGPT